jgi:hypothetical protein
MEGLGKVSLLFSRVHRPEVFAGNALRASAFPFATDSTFDGVPADWLPFEAPLGRAQTLVSQLSKPQRKLAAAVGQVLNSVWKS